MLTPATLAAASGIIEATVDKHAADLLDLRRDLHAHPELAFAEHRTTGIAIERVTERDTRPWWTRRAWASYDEAADRPRKAPVAS